MKSPLADSLPSREDPRRVAACLKACEGIATEALEAQVILRLVAACVHIQSPRVREVLLEMAGPAATRPRRAQAEPARGSLRAIPSERMKSHAASDEIIVTRLPR